MTALPTIEIVSREIWGARPPKKQYGIDQPTPELWLHHSAGPESGIAGMRSMQNFHMDNKKWSDIAYSHVICPRQMSVYEGRGNGFAGGHTKGHNTISHGICVMGNFMNEPVTEELVDLIAALVRRGWVENWWPQVLTGGHRDVSANLCPGDNLYNQIIEINHRTLTAPDAPVGDALETTLEGISIENSTMLVDAVAELETLFLAYHNRGPNKTEVAKWWRALAEDLYGPNRRDPSLTLREIALSLREEEEPIKLT